MPQASINSFATTLPSFYDHEIRFATSNRGLSIWDKKLKKIRCKLCQIYQIREFLSTSTLYGNIVNSNCVSSEVSDGSPASFLSSIPATSIVGLEPTDSSEILDMIRKLDMRKAAGCDGIPVRAVKLFGSHIADPIATIINSSLKEGVVPIQWKSAVVRPIEKKKGCISLDNYRPISVLPVKAKGLYFSEYSTTSEDLIMSDSTGIPIQVSSPETWTIGKFFETHLLQPSKYKLYFMLDMKV